MQIFFPLFFSLNSLFYTVAYAVDIFISLQHIQINSQLSISMAVFLPETNWPDSFKQIQICESWFCILVDIYLSLFFKIIVNTRTYSVLSYAFSIQRILFGYRPFSSPFYWTGIICRKCLNIKVSEFHPISQCEMIA